MDTKSRKRTLQFPNSLQPKFQKTIIKCLDNVLLKESTSTNIQLKQLAHTTHETTDASPSTQKRPTPVHQHRNKHNGTHSRLEVCSESGQSGHPVIHPKFDR